MNNAVIDLTREVKPVLQPPIFQNVSSQPSIQVQSVPKREGENGTFEEYAKYLETLNINELKTMLTFLQSQLMELKNDSSKRAAPDQRAVLLVRKINHVSWQIEKWNLTHPQSIAKPESKPSKTTSKATSTRTSKRTVSPRDVEGLFAKVQAQLSNKTTKQYTPSKKFRVALYEHQKVGVEWMISQEASQVKGGMLADDMGLGKTIQVLALLDHDLVARKSAQDQDDEHEDNQQITLVVCPLALLQQWQSEIQRKFVKGAWSVLVYHGKTRFNSSNVDADIVLTTYDSLAQDFKKKENSFLYQTQFHRVILDEAQLITNTKTMRFQAVQALQSTYRWALTGTPIQNSVKDLAAFLSFLKFEPWTDPKQFSKSIVKGNTLKMLEVILPCLVLRRTKNTIALPPATVLTHSLDFTPTEQTLYRNVLRTFKSNFSEMEDSADNGELMRFCLMASLRLLQTCTHPLLLEASATKKDAVIQKAFEDFLAQVSVEKNANMKPKQVDLVATNLDNSTNTQDVDDIDLLAADIKKLDIEPALKDAQCAICLGVPEGAVTLACCNAWYCRECLLEYMATTFEKPICKSCNAAIPASTTETLSAPDTTNSKVSSDFVPSKVAFLLSELKKIADECKTTKSIVYSQWTSMLSLLEPYLSSAGIKYTRMDGTMSATKKGEAISKFKDDPEVTVLLLSLKAGGLGLNLVEATHVFMMDLWWNPSVEQQAYDRVHRIGQTKPVTVHRVVMKSSFEQSVMKRQEEKKQLAQNVLGAAKNRVFMMNIQDFKNFFEEQDDE